MEIQLKQRVIGAVVIFTLLIIFLPILFQDDSDQQYVEQILEPPISDKKLSSIQPEKVISKDFMSDSLDNIVLDANSTMDADEKIKPVKPESSLPVTEKVGDKNLPTTEKTDPNSVKKLDNATKEAAVATAEADKAPRVVQNGDDALQIKKPRTPNEVYAIKLGNYASKVNALKAKQKLLGIGFPAYIALNGNSYNLYVGPELETKYIKALVKRISEETEFTPQVVVHNSSWKTE